MNTPKSHSESPSSGLEQLDVPSAAPADTLRNHPLQNGSEWGRKALEGIREMHQNEEARKAVARRLF